MKSPRDAGGGSAAAQKPESAATTRKIRNLKDFCRDLPGTTQDIKWSDHLCFSVRGKMYAIFDVVDRLAVAFKVDDIEFDRLTKKPGVIPAPYAARFGWVKVVGTPGLTEAQMRRLLRRSRELIIEKLPPKRRAAVVGAIVEAGVEAKLEASDRKGISAVTTPRRGRPRRGR